jgi:hypothetical protein
MREALRIISVGLVIFGICHGALPAKPAVPAGCRDLVPQCMCDSNGKNCTWVWVCVG